MKKVLSFLNPIDQLGSKQYSFVFPFFTVVFISALLEFYAYYIAQDPEVVGNYAIFLYITLIIYFSFRDGVLGGFVATTITIAYYAYIIYSRNYVGDELTASIRTTTILAFLYIFLSSTIGWLKQTIDYLIIRESDGRRRLKTIVQQLPIGVVVFNTKGVTELSNRHAEKILGQKIPIGIKAMDQSLVISTEKGKTISGAQLMASEVIKTGKRIIDKDYFVQRKDGKSIAIQASATPIVNYEGKPIAAALMLADVTEKKELEKRKDDFVNMASHELKTPITSLKLYLETLSMQLQKKKDDRSLALVTSIKIQTDRLHKLVNDLLDVSRYQTGKLTFQKEEFRLDELLQEIANDLQATTDKYSIQLTSSQKVKVVGDKFRLSQVVINLITNAMKYSPENTDILISAKRNGTSVTVCVRDFGIGIPKDKQKKIFDRLYQVTNSNERSFPGFGMGLYIAKEIIKRHKGKIWVESKENHGSQFYFTLPLPKTKLNTIS